MKKGNVFWGVVLILVALLIVVDRLGVADISLVRVILTIFFAAFLVKGITKLSIPGVIMPASFLCILYRDVLGIERLSVVTIMVVAILVSIGLDLIFGPMLNKKKIGHEGHIEVDFESKGSKTSHSESMVEFNTIFSSATKYITSNSFQYGTADCVFGSMAIYFDDASLCNGQGELKVDCVFGNVKIYIPKIWLVVNDMNTILGHVSEKGQCQSAGVSALHIYGDVVFGNLEIIYI